MRADSSVDGPLLQVPAKPWTDVTDDDELVSHLVTLYFTWSHPCLQVLEEAIFRSHMNAGYLDSAYCTPFLVNCILALATVRCHFIPHWPVVRRFRCYLRAYLVRCIPIPRIFSAFLEGRFLAGRTS